MQNPLTLTIFPAPTLLGQRLAESIKMLGTSIGFHVNIAKEFNQIEFLKSCLCNSVVVMDASIEEHINNVYQIATIPTFDHLLVVSRTYLPLNFIPVRLGGAPPYPYPHVNLSNGQRIAGFETFIWNSEEILNWLQIQLNDIQQSPLSYRLTPEEFSALSITNISSLHKVLDDSISGRKIIKNTDAAKIFISYRGKYYQEVKKLAGSIENGDFHQGTKKSVRLFFPGELALEREILSEGRRWMVLNLLDDELRDCEELWVYQTDDYLNSWWTLGEIVVAACIGKPIKVYCRQNNSVMEDEGSYSIKLTNPQIEKLALIRSNTHPNSMALDTNQMLRYQRWVFKLGLGNFMFKLLNRMINDPDFQKVFRMEKETIDFMLTPNKYRDFINDRVFSKEFWNELCIEPAWALGKEPNYYNKDVNFFIDAPETQTVRINTRIAKSSIESGKSVKALDQRTNIRIEEYPPRYLWRPSRNEIVANVRGGLEKLPTYVVV
jgi:hypothetical protein